MRRLILAVVAGLVGVALLGLVLTLPVAAGQGRMWAGWSGSGDPITIEQARERASEYLGEIGEDALAIGEVMEFSNHFYVAVIDPTSGAGAFELLVSRDGRSVHPEPTMMWNTQHSPMLGGQGMALHRGMMSGGMHGGMMAGGMMGGNMGRGMMDGGDGDQQHMMDPSQCQGLMSSVVAPGQQLEQPLTTDAAVMVAQDWLAANQPGLAAGEPLAFPGYVTLHTERDGQTVGMLSVQTSSGAVWEHTWHGDFVAIDHGE